MSSYKFTCLGSNAGSVSAKRYPSGYLLQLENQKILFDCGEGTQFRMRDLKIKFSSIDIIAITHIHGDHYLGLPGLLHTMSMQGRKRPLILICPKDLETILELQFSLIQNHPEFPIEYLHTDAVEEGINLLLHENPFVKISGIKLQHRIHTCGFLVEEKRNPRKINPEAIAKAHLQSKKEDFEKLQQGENIIWEGKEILNTELTLANEQAFSFAFLTDTIYLPDLPKQISNCMAIFHEATYSQSEEQRAIENGHSTTSQAAWIAQQAHVKQLLIGHYSSRYDDISALEKEAQAIFKNSIGLREGMVLEWKEIFEII